MKRFKRLFNKNSKTEIPPIPSREEIIKIMYDKQLDYFSDMVVNTVYSKDKSMRYVILENEKGYLTYQFEELHQFSEYEWAALGSAHNDLPAIWEPFSDRKSIFENTEELLKEMEKEPNYKQYFI